MTQAPSWKKDTMVEIRNTAQGDLVCWDRAAHQSVDIPQPTYVTERPTDKERATYRMSQDREVSRNRKDSR